MIRSAASFAFLIALAAGCQIISGADEIPFSPGGGAGGHDQGGRGGGGGAGGDGGAGGGTGGGGGCRVADDCPGIDDACKKRNCVNGACEIETFAEGNACTRDDGQGVCDGEGSCVACNVDEDCDDTMLECDQHECVPASCTNRTKDGDETGVDCGGPDCAPCEQGGGCIDGTDCVSGYCDTSGGAGGAGGAGGQNGTGTCAPCSSDGHCSDLPDDAFCNDQGSCEAKRSLGEACDEASWCKSGNCADGVCCNTACTQDCLACSASKTPEPNGTCAPVNDGSDPNDDCGSASTCCDGSCRLLSLGC